jgi:hypothetical protein
MKKVLALPVAALCLLFACQKSDKHTEVTPESEPTEAVQRACASHEVLEEQMAADPARRQRMAEIEAFTKRAVESGEAGRLVNGVIEIPVIVNVIYRTSTENISATQIQSQIDVLNEDFNNTNADRTKVPAEFTDEQTSVGIRFVLEGVNRKYSSKRSWSTNDDMKFASKGGIDATTPATHLNMWVVNKMQSYGSTILGYAQFPGGNPATDGVVIGYNFFGRVGSVSSPFNLGRTATHEVGHWMNLRHIWGDATCGNDQVADTPPHNTYNYGCPTYPHKSTCAGTPVEMTMNYMDYTDDACMYMFTDGQKVRMDAIFASGGPRASFAQ